MVIDRPQAKQAARNLMRTARVSPYQIGLIYVIIVFALSAFEQTMLQLFGIPYYLSYSYYSTVLMPSPINWFITILVWLISIVLAAGFATYCLAIRRGKEMPLSTLFDGFSIAGKVILLEIVAGIFIFLWSLLLIIPGIIATYRYRFALYNLLENPDLGILEAINLSKEQTYGYKWQLFVLDLSFLGWLILDVFTMGFLGIWLIPYITLTDIAFYDTICAEKGMTAGSGDAPHTSGPYNGPYSPPSASSGSWDHAGSQWNTAPRSTPPAPPPALDNGAPPAEEPQTQTPPQAPSAGTPGTSPEPWERPQKPDPWSDSEHKSHE